jgi:hypothetical protein
MIHARADFTNRADNFVPGDGRRHHVLLPMKENALVGAADRAAQNPQDNFPRPCRGARDGLNPNVPYTVKNCGFHQSLHGSRASSKRHRQGSRIVKNRAAAVTGSTPQTGVLTTPQNLLGKL